MNDQELLTHLRLELNVKNPDVSDCWAEGYESAHASLSESENPYPEGTKAAEYWRDGWWAGVYNEEPLFDLVEAPKPEEQVLPKRSWNIAALAGQVIMGVGAAAVAGFFVYDLIVA